ncbi:MAG: hypothetical protein LJE75_01495 [Gammaproteobacteria bacterium]|jgi:hypothetical protein|nr:hypothetical protein [Gammaproteobacteria bacterium]
MKACFKFPLIIAALFAETSLADTTIRLGGNEDASRTVIQVKDHMARMSQSGQPGYVLFDKSRHVAIYVDPLQQEYREIDQQQLDKYAEVIALLRQQMEQLSAQLQNLPAAQRAFIEQQMGIPAGGLPDLEVMGTEARGIHDVAGFRCQQQLLLRNGQPIGEVCLATAADAGMSENDFDTLMAMMDFMRELAGTTQKLVGELGENSRLLLSGLQGVPVAMKDYQTRMEYRVTEVTSSTIPADVFNSYRSYRKQDLLLNLPGQ